MISKFTASFAVGDTSLGALLLIWPAFILMFGWVLILALPQVKPNSRKLHYKPLSVWSPKVKQDEIHECWKIIHNQYLLNIIYCFVNVIIKLLLDLTIRNISKLYHPVVDTEGLGVEGSVIPLKNIMFLTVYKIFLA